MKEPQKTKWFSKPTHITGLQEVEYGNLHSLGAVDQQRGKIKHTDSFLYKFVKLKQALTSYNNGFINACLRKLLFTFFSTEK